MANETEGLEPWQEATLALAKLSATMREVTAEFDEAERVLRNARMSDALDLSESELAGEFPEVGEDVLALAAEEPYAFWTETDDAGMIARAGGAAKTAAGLVDRISRRQPPLGE